MPALNSVTTPAVVIRPIRLPVFREPQIAVRTGRDAVGKRAGADAGAELGDDAGGGDPPDAVAVDSVNQRLPSGPAAIAVRMRVGVMPALNSVTTPAVVIRPIGWRLFREPEIAVGAGGDADRRRAGGMPALNSVMTPAVVIRPIRLPPIP